MTINLFFITVTIQWRKKTREEIEHERLVKQIEEEIMDRKCSMHKLF
ncbi:YrzI family small protein [Anoxybacillus caldiproteolyticus]|nr:YrzI family small protein [Anoxybacillus caldiproteolyticus]QPA33232.1 YrzI family small protein [Anoxybacillus caldiproteolyticus]